MEAEPTKKEEIMEAAIQVFVEEGFHSAGVRDIAEQAKVAIGTIYHYFNHKEDILIQIFRKEADARQRFFENLRASDLSIKEQIRRVVEMYFEGAKENRQLAKLILTERLESNERLQKVVRRLREEMTHYIGEIIEEGIEKKEIAPCNPAITSRAFLGAVEEVICHGVLYNNQKVGTNLSEALGELAGFFWDWLFQDSKD